MGHLLIKHEKIKSLKEQILFSFGSIRFLEVHVEYSLSYQLFDIDDPGQFFECLADSFLRRVDIGFCATGRRVTQDALDHQHIDIVVIEVRCQTMSQGMAGDVKGYVNVGLKQYFFKVVFHGPNRQAIALFGDKKSPGTPAV